TFRQVSYHTLFWTDCYLSSSESTFELRDLHREGGDERASAEPSAGLSQEQTLTHVDFCRRKLLSALAAETAESLQGACGFSRLQFSRGELHLYNLRHVQHHAGQLSAYLRRVVEDGEWWWVKSGWR